MAKLPLEGIRVVDIAVIWAGPFGAWQLASLGAEVIHIDNPHHRPDRGRWEMWLPPRSVFNPVGGGPPPIPGQKPWNASPGYNRYYWNRKACSINLNDPEGKEIFKRLIKEADVFLENNSATAMENLGFGHDILMEANPNLICINAPGWGRNGPYKNYVGWGALHEAIVGHTWLRGYNDDEHPMHSNMRFHMDSAGGATIAMAAIMGLIRRQKTGKGMWVDLAQIQTVPNHLGEIYMDTAWNNRDHSTIGNRHPTAAQGVYLCRGPEPTFLTAQLGGEKWINITIHNDEEWEGFCNAIGNPDWTKDAKFGTVASRHENHDELDSHIAAWTIKHDNFEIFYILQEHGVPSGPVEDWHDTFTDPQLNAREFFITTGNEDSGTHRHPGFPWKFSETPLQYQSPPMKMGEHTEEVCKEIMGMSDEEYADLKAREIVGLDTYPWAGERPDYESYGDNLITPD